MVRMVMDSDNICIYVNGFGNIGRAFVELVISEHNLLEVFNARICGVFDSSGGVVSVQGLKWEILKELLNIPRSGLGSSIVGKKDISVLDVVDEGDIVIEVTPSIYNPEHQVNKVFVKLIEKGVYIVTANKAPLALNPGLIRSYGMPGPYQRLYFSATVMAGTPLINLLYGLRGRNIVKIRALLNATTNYLLTLMEQGYSFEEALKKAQEEGIAEPNPALDVEGWDAAAKAAIVSTVVGWPRKIEDVVRVPLSEAGSDIEQLKIAKKKLKYMAMVSEREAIVKPESIGPESKLYHVTWNYNAVEIWIEVGEKAYKIFLEGPGGGRKPTADALFSDTITLLSTLKRSR
ncbi:MAG TPA: homoserine dehydrogenase [Pyrodictium sp.]|nr:homoserine dehydrogenase [Pyrodictium sp.]HIQ11154.1 homoserine dehydrogenase [Pyrodictium sp.]